MITLSKKIVKQKLHLFKLFFILCTIKIFYPKEEKMNNYYDQDCGCKRKGYTFGNYEYEDNYDDDRNYGYEQNCKCNHNDKNDCYEDEYEDKCDCQDGFEKPCKEHCAKVYSEHNCNCGCKKEEPKHDCGCKKEEPKYDCGCKKDDHKYDCGCKKEEPKYDCGCKKEDHKCDCGCKKDDHKYDCGCKKEEHKHHDCERSCCCKIFIPPFPFRCK